MCKDDACAVLKEKGVTNLMEAQLKKAIYQVEEEHHAARSYKNQR